MNDLSGSLFPIPILMYHEICKSAEPKLLDKLYVTQRDFQWQMAALKRGGYTAISFYDLDKAFAGELSLPEKPFLVTFDDGYNGVYEYAAPVLERFDWPYTVFLVTGLIGKSNEWDAGKGFPSLSLMDWKRIEELDKNSLASFQPHTKTHIRLSNAEPGEAKRQVFESRDEVEQKLGKKTHVFCYPYGDRNGDVLKIVGDAGYQLGVTTDFGRVRARDRGLVMPRVAVHHVPAVSLTYGLAAPNFWWRIKSRKDNRP